MEGELNVKLKLAVSFVISPHDVCLERHALV
jgi:hypothetical protein